MGTISPPPGHHQHATDAVSASASSATGWSPWKLALFALAAIAAVLWFRRPSYLPDLALPSATAGGTASGSSDSPILCTGANGCLVVYVAPWCGPCRSSLPGDVALADHIRTKGYETVFVVGMDKTEACFDMTRSIGRPTRLDTDGKWAKAAGVSGVPHFLVTTPMGKIVKRQAGAYMAPPDQVAQLLGIS
jgi:thiol-disulfide isomerase/thioredoxin